VGGLKETKSVNYTVRDLRKNFDELTDMLIGQLNKINGILRNIEEEKNKAICYNEFPPLFLLNKTLKNFENDMGR